ncbi:MLO-like protein 15 [Chenopodium quinoa]|uniref:MLO-like protein 15 n=1 Tax=Chenopodium quinoa TaxID=63459 RepID=UPI000B774EDB|nr:MLO-like protein 15 [Chenopodium quinoa]
MLQMLKSKKRKSLYKALQKIKEELILLGFVSLLLAVFQDDIANKCISDHLTEKWIPCRDDKSTSKATSHLQISNGGRHLLAAEDISSCPSGKVSFVSIGVLHELHILIFILAIVHVACCTLTVLLGEVKISHWKKKWERSIRKQNKNDINNDNRVIHVRSLTFIKERCKGDDANKRHYVISFFKHLAGILTKADYAAMRLGFTLTHCNTDQRFNFQKYLVYAYEHDFQKVVSINWFLWIFVVISFTLNVAGWNIYFWISFVPLVVLLIVETKLEQVITELAIYVAQRHTVIVGGVQIQTSDSFFWFSQPKYVLLLIHIILFFNSFGIAIFFWTWLKFGFHSCVMGETKFVYARIVIMVVIQTICSYSTLPLYAIVTQMRNSYNKEAMKRLSIESSNRVTEGSSPERSDTIVSVEMENQLEGQGSIQTVEETE